MISEHIALLKAMDVKPNEVMGSLCAVSFHRHKNFGWGHVRTQIERWQSARMRQDYQTEDVEMLAEEVATEGVRMRLNNRGEEVVREFKLADINIRIDDDG
jgi:hypothetical protein